VASSDPVVWSYHTCQFTCPPTDFNTYHPAAQPTENPQNTPKNTLNWVLWQRSPSCSFVSCSRWFAHTDHRRSIPQGKTGCTARCLMHGLHGVIILRRCVTIKGHEFTIIWQLLVNIPRALIIIRHCVTIEGHELTIIWQLIVTLQRELIIIRRCVTIKGREFTIIWQMIVNIPRELITLRRCVTIKGHAFTIIWHLIVNIPHELITLRRMLIIISRSIACASAVLLFRHLLVTSKAGDMLDGERVKEARLALGCTQRDFARLVGVEPSTICKIEHDDFPGIRLEIALRIAWALRRHVCQVLKGYHVHPCTCGTAAPTTEFGDHPPMLRVQVTGRQ
jgi:DNA-binding XRE family transcriptional regulator